MTEKQLQAALKTWQQKLRLQDWNITLEFINDEDIEDWKPAEVRYQIYDRWAKIRMLKPGLRADAETPYHPEQSLVHELLHLVVAPFSHGLKEDASEITREQALNAIADALVGVE